MIAALILLPAVAGILSLLVRVPTLRRALLVCVAAAHTALTAAAWQFHPRPCLNGWLAVDALGLCFLSLTSLLFLAANAVKEGTHCTFIQRLGGLHKRIPVTGGCFALGSAAIAGMPPFNGFMSEMLVYLGFLLGSEATRGTEAALVFWAAFFTLGGIAGLALFAFTRLFGLAFLGAPRGSEVLEAREPERLLRLVMLFLAAIRRSKLTMKSRPRPPSFTTLLTTSKLLVKTTSLKPSSRPSWCRPIKTVITFPFVSLR